MLVDTGSTGRPGSTSRSKVSCLSSRPLTILMPPIEMISSSAGLSPVVSVSNTV